MAQRSDGYTALAMTDEADVEDDTSAASEASEQSDTRPSTASEARSVWKSMALLVLPAL